MSEYQYYEFQAIDRPLTDKEMAELRSYSTRARITPTSFVNDYSWGNFKGDEDAWMERYFDAFLYLANWGTHVLKLRLPARLLDAETARSYCAGDRASVHAKHGKVILTFASEDEGGSDWVEGDGHLSSLISVRAELGRGDPAACPRVVDPRRVAAASRPDRLNGVRFAKASANRRGERASSAGSKARPSG